MREREIEKHLMKCVKEKGGLCIKMHPLYFAGVPDRLCLLPDGIMFFVELKATGKKTRPLQDRVIKIIRKLGFTVYVLDNKDDVEFAVEIETGTC